MEGPLVRLKGTGLTPFLHTCRTADWDAVLQDRPMQLIGLTGGIASGKSTAAVYLEGRGIPVIDADRLAREALCPGQAAYRRVCRRFPAAVGADGTLDRIIGEWLGL